MHIRIGLKSHKRASYACAQVSKKERERQINWIHGAQEQKEIVNSPCYLFRCTRTRTTHRIYLKSSIHVSVSCVTLLAFAVANRLSAFCICNSERKLIDDAIV